MNETEVEVEDYEEVVGDLNYTGTGRDADSFKEPTLNQNVSSLTPQNRPILRSSNLSLAGDLQESIPEVVIMSPERGTPIRTPQGSETQRLNENQSVPRSKTWRSPLAVGMQTLRNLLDWSPSTIQETQHEATRNSTVSPQLQSPATVQPIRSSVISPEQSIGHPMQRKLFGKP